MDDKTLQLTDCVVRYDDQSGNLEFNYSGQPSQGQEKKSGPSALESGVTWIVPRDEVQKLSSFIEQHRTSSIS